MLILMNYKYKLYLTTFVEDRRRIEVPTMDFFTHFFHKTNCSYSAQIACLYAWILYV